MEHGITWVEVNERALKHNYSVFRRVAGDGVGMICVVKANAYGHGAIQVARRLASWGADFLGVHSFQEAEQLRAEGVACPILVMGGLTHEELTEATAAGYHIGVSSLADVAALQKTALPARIHLKFDTGMGRQGLPADNAEELQKILEELESSHLLNLVGLWTHFSSADETVVPEVTRQQIHSFDEKVRFVREAGFNPPYVHAANTAASLLYPEAHYNLLRPGLGLYGLWPSRETREAFRAVHPDLDLEPVLTWKARIIQVKKLPRGHTVGYGRTFRATRETLLAVLPVGYADGYFRCLSQKAWVAASGSRLPVVGRVSMNLICADLTEAPHVEVGDEVVLLGRDGEASVSADDLANLAGTINYEVVARINPRIPRHIVD